MSATEPKSLAEDSPLPVDLAFVVQLREACRPDLREFQGRVEHITTGDSCSFGSLDELQVFMALTVGEASVKADGDRAH